jgi:uncharacterized membrane protein YhiD involved in acid resistance
MDWFGLAVGLGLMGIGIVLTVSVWGAIIGLPALVASVALLTNPTTLRGTPCA